MHTKIVKFWEHDKMEKEPPLWFNRHNTTE